MTQQMVLQPSEEGEILLKRASWRAWLQSLPLLQRLKLPLIHQGPPQGTLVLDLVGSSSADETAFPWYVACASAEQSLAAAGQLRHPLHAEHECSTLLLLA